MTNAKDPKERFREALERKKASGSPSSANTGKKSKVQGGQASGGAPKLFRRKSGPS